MSRRGDLGRCIPSPPVAFHEGRMYAGIMSWCVVHLRPRCEKKAASHCSANGIEHYLPLREETKVYQRRKVTVYKPIFPGYIFVSGDHDQRTTLLESNAVVSFIDPPDESRLIHELDQVRKALEADPRLEACNAITRGRLVRIIGGPFMGVEGLVASIRSKTKVCLNVEMIGQAVPVEVDRDYLEPID